jgi:adenylate cyclase
VIAEAINILNSSEAGKPSVIALDVLYTEEGADPKKDEALALSIAEGGNVVLVSHIEFGRDRENLSLRKVITDYRKPIPALEAHAAYGAANAILDRDNTIRRVLLKAEYEGEWLYSFPSVIAQQYTGSPPDAFTRENNEAYLNFTGFPDNFNNFSIADVFEDDFDPAFYIDCIILIGPWAAGMSDSHNTPLSHRSDVVEQMYGVEIHANAVQMMLDENYKKRAPEWARLTACFAAIAIAMLLWELLKTRYAAVISLVLCAMLCAGYLLAAQWLYGQGTVMTFLYVPAAFGIVVIYQVGYGYAMNVSEKARLRDVFKKYADPRIVDKLIASGAANSEESGRERNIAVLFADIRGFTPLCERLYEKPEEIAQMLNEYLALIVSAVFENGGSVDKFIGDAAMALFNGFVPTEDYVFRAVKTAWNIVERSEKVNTSVRAKYDLKEDRGEYIGIGVGVHFGDAIVGSFGPDFRKDYTAIGDTVNIAARLETEAKFSQVLISRAVYDELAGRINAVSLGEKVLKGKTLPVEVMAVTGIIG